MRKNVVSLIALSLVLGAGSLTVGCDEADELFDCSQICSRYEECIDGDYDVTDCIDRCEADADQDEAYADRADACETCLDDNDSCAEDLPCADECVGIVP